MDKKGKAPRILQGVPYDVQNSIVLVTTQQHLVDVGEFCSMLQPPSGGVGQNPPAGGHQRAAALVSPATGVAAKHWPIMAIFGLAAGSETRGAHIKHLTILGHTILPARRLLPATPPLNVQGGIREYSTMIQQARA